MTAWEGHVTDAGAENSLIVKRFTFRCVNSFSRLFYLGFWQRRDTGSFLSVALRLYCEGLRHRYLSLQYLPSPVLNVFVNGAFSLFYSFDHGL